MLFRIRVVQALIHFFEQLFFYPRLKRFYTSLKINAPITIVDVGANKGQSINFFLRIYPSALIYAFEPNKQLYSRLIDKYQDLPNVKLFNMGASNINGVLNFHENVLDETSSFAAVNKDSAYLKKKALILGVSPDKLIKTEYQVQVITLSNFFNAHNIRQVTILKIDVEGHEHECIQGLMGSDKTIINIVQLEKHNDDMYLQDTLTTDISALLDSMQFNCIKTIPHPFGNFDEVVYGWKINSY